KAKRYAIIFNGEIFNYQQLRNKYFSAEEQKQLHTTSDTEILLELFIKQGEKCLPLLEGFFVFVIYDTESKELFIARDRFGKKPLNFFIDDDRFIFASEIKALFDFGIPKELNYEALQLYLQLGYIPQPLSMLKHVRKLEPGSRLILKGKNIEEKKWYRLTPSYNYKNAPSYEQAQKELVTLLEDAVVKRLISDVPLGAFLSGGIDSSVIVALASRHQKSLNTFSIGFKGEQYFDETHFAELVAAKFKTNHATFRLGFDDYLSHIYDVLNYFDEPFADSASLPQFILCMETRKHATVAISGDGGDEVFAGYNKHYAEWVARKKSLAGTIVKMGYPIWKMMPKSRNNRFSDLFRQLHRYAEGAGLSAQDRYWHWASTFSDRDLDKLVANTASGKINSSIIDSVKEKYLSNINDDFNSVLKADLDLVLISDMLVKVDLMSMANSVEVRCPFLDHHVVEFAFSLPSDYKINKAGRKKIVKDAFRNILPPEIYNRGKRGFEIPMLKWFREELHTYIFDDLLNEKFVKEQGIFNIEYIGCMKKQLYSNAPGHIVEQLWVLIVFQHWYKKYFM
ncbi:MAG TPA: asparagine synthase (glutamine-hydrolyzing), partial [Chitinophagaceae bacterium]|nr:asparagine synthase (glutamine-hydrolyzing) [Chitinophagaceae bacterium]